LRICLRTRSVGARGRAAAFASAAASHSAWIERAPDASRLIQRDQSERVRLLDELARRRTHPEGERGETIATPAALEIEHEPTRVVLTGERRAGALELEALHRSAAAERIGRRFGLERESAPRAPGRPEKPQFAPELGLDAARRIDDPVRKQRLRRPDQIDRHRGEFAHGANRAISIVFG
jgi:hypothetical protein